MSSFLLTVAPSAPSAISLVNCTGTDMVICWRAPVNNGGDPVHGYYLDQREKSQSMWHQVNVKPVKERLYTVSHSTSVLPSLQWCIITMSFCRFTEHPSVCFYGSTRSWDVLNGSTGIVSMEALGVGMVSMEAQGVGMVSMEHWESGWFLWSLFISVLSQNLTESHRDAWAHSAVCCSSNTTAAFFYYQTLHLTTVLYTVLFLTLYIFLHDILLLHFSSFIKINTYAMPLWQMHFVMCELG